jgi:hypothetical protein
MLGIRISKAILLAVCFIVSLASFQVCAQTRLANKPVEPTTCEYLKHALDYSILEVNESEKTYLILIFRPGNGEKMKVVRSRAYVVEKYLRFRDPKFGRLVYGRSDATDSLGRLDIYISGEKKWEIFFRKNKQGWDSCIE